MGYTCFKCRRQSTGHTVRDYFEHLKLAHNIHTSSSYFQCAENGCQRTFSHARSFRRHLLGHCIDLETVGEVSEQCHESPSNIINVESEPIEECEELEVDYMQERVALFIARLRSKSSRTVSGIIDSIEETSGLITDIVGDLKLKTEMFLRAKGHAGSPEAEELLKHFTTAAKPFQGLETDFKQMKYFTQSGNFIQPETVPLPGFSYTQERDRETGIVRQVAVRDTFQCVPLKPTLKCIVESAGTIEKILQWREGHSGAIEDFRDGTIFATNSLFSDELSIPLVLYCDDCEMVNPLGSKTSVHKLGFIYFTIKCLPPEYLSSLKSHFLLAVYKTDDVKTYGINAVLEPIVSQIKDMELNGVQVETAQFQGSIKAGVAQVCGDNLGLNSILGYTESFSGNSVCRWCQVHRPVLKVQTLEDPSTMRTKVNYQSDLLLNNPTETGVKRECSLNKLEFYHVTDNVTPDIMHDILEGVGGFELKLVLNSLIEQKILTLDQLNYRLTSFDYGFADCHNKPSLIRPQDLKNPDGSFRQTAAQTWCLLRLLPLMVGDLVPEGNRHWELLLSLLSCMELIFSPELTDGAVTYLKHLIEEHHCRYLELYPDRHLKPKHHFMVHYPGAIRKLGPIIHFWCMRFEAKHAFFKRVSQVTCNFRNICKTQAYRHQLQMCYTLLSGQLFSHDFQVGPGTTELLGTIEDFESVKSDFEGIGTYTEVYLASWIKHKGTSYRPGMTLLVSMSADGDPQFGTIRTIVLVDKTIKLIVKNWETLGFERHFFAFTVSPTSSVKGFDIDSIVDHHPLHVVRSHKDNDDDYYISMRYKLV